MSLTDQELLEGMRQGNLPSLDALLSRYGRPLLAFFYFLSWDRHGAEDSVQEVFRTFWHRRDSRRPVGVVKYELFQMAMTLRPRTRPERPEVGTDTEISWSHPFWSAYLQPPDWDEGPTGEWAEKVKAALDTLPEEDRILLVLTRYGGLDPESASEVVGVPVADVREALHRSLDGLAKPLATGGADLPPPCSEAPPGFPLPGEPVPPGEHVESCASCGPRIEKHRDVWEHLADLEPPNLREGLWHELKKSLVSGMKVRISYPTGRLPRPVPEEVRIGKRTSRFWLRFTVVISVVLALIAVYVGLVPKGEDAVPRIPPDADASGGPGGRERAARLPAMKPLPFSILGGAPDPLGLTLSIRGFGSGTLTCSVYRVENPDVFL
ncbi:MAG: RNA polymerase sigma factor, partial [Planctomycetota bacterium]